MQSHTQHCILHIQGQSSVPHNHSPTDTNVSQLHFQRSLRQVHGQTKRDMKSSLISVALIRWKEGVSTLDGGRPLLDRTAITNYPPLGQATKPAPNSTPTLPQQDITHLAFIRHTLDKPTAGLRHSVFFSKCVKSLIITCLNCINNPPGFNRIFL